MAIKGGQIIHAGNGKVVVDRVQTGGPGQLNIPTEKIYELGNYKSVATVRDTPDLTFSLESFDTSTEVEALVSGQYGGSTVTGDMTAASATFTATTGTFDAADEGAQIVVPGANAGGTDLITTVTSVDSPTTATLADAAVVGVTGVTAQLSALGGIDLAKAGPIDIASQFKAGQNAPDPYQVISSIAAPFLTIEQMSYRFGLRDNASQTAQLRGDTVFYNPGSCFVEEAAGTGTAGQVIATAQPAYQVAEGDNRRVLSVTAGTKRLSFGADYTETYGTVTGGAAVTTVTLDDAVPTNETVRIVYSSPALLTYPEDVHPSVVVKPAAVKGRDIEVYVGGYDPNDVAGSQANKLLSVQAATVDWRVTIEKDEEFGNPYAVSQDFDVPTVNGSVDIKPRDAADLQALIRKVSGITDPNAVLGTKSSVPLTLDIVIKNPEDNDRVMKRLHVPDARFTPPGVSGRVQTKLTTTLPFESDEGGLLVYAR